MATKRLRLPDLGRRISDAREAAGFTQVQLAEALGTTSMSISRYERGVMGPSPVALYGICLVLEVSADALLGLPGSAAG